MEITIPQVVLDRIAELNKEHIKTELVRLGSTEEDLVGNLDCLKNWWDGRFKNFLKDHLKTILDRPVQTLSDTVYNNIYIAHEKAQNIRGENDSSLQTTIKELLIKSNQNENYLQEDYSNDRSSKNSALEYIEWLKKILWITIIEGVVRFMGDEV